MGAFAPYGYVKNEEKKPPLLIDEYAAPIVHRIFELRAGGLGYRTIATKLNDEGITPPREYYIGINIDLEMVIGYKYPPLYLLFSFHHAGQQLLKLSGVK